jgi:hypothetical protein
MAQRVY